MGALFALAWADLLERVRRSSFLVVLGLVMWLAIGVFTGDVLVIVGESQGAMGPAWAGGMMTLVAVTILTLAGFWVVRNAVERDERTGVGEILATTPMSRVTYTLGKAASHFAVLLAMLAILCAAGLVLLVARSAGVAFDAGQYFTPFVLIALPALALTAACAVVFETTPGLRGGAGSALWIFAWTGILIASFSSKSPWLDPWGFTAVTASLNDAARAHLPDHVDGLNITIGGAVRFDPSKTFPWSGVAWTPALVASRFAWLLAAAALAALAALPFHRFDPSRGLARKTASEATSARGATHTRLAALARLHRFVPYGRIGSELRLMLAGGRAGWWLVAFGLVVAGLAVPPNVAHGVILPLAWLWPLTRFAELGARERRYATTGFLFPSAGYLPKQMLAAWAAGVILALVAGSGAALKLALALDGAGLVAYGAGALFVPALALALGTLSGTPRLFEVVYSLLWYLGPMQHVAALDYAGATPGSAAAPWIVLALIGITTALVARALQRR